VSWLKIMTAAIGVVSVLSLAHAQDSNDAQNTVAAHIWSLTTSLTSGTKDIKSLTGLASNVQVKRYDYGSGRTYLAEGSAAVEDFYRFVTTKDAIKPEVECHERPVKNIPTLYATDCFFSFRVNDEDVQIFVGYAVENNQITSILQGPIYVDGKFKAGPEELRGLVRGAE
jgi:hypothetical protein